MTVTMKAVNRRWIAIGCLLLGICGGAVGAQVVESILNVRYLNSGLVELAPGNVALFNVTLDDVRSGQPARVRLQFYDEAGIVVGSNDVVLAVGHTTTLRITGERAVRAHAELIEPTLQFSARRRVFGTMEVFDLTGAKLPPSCTFDGTGVNGGRQ